MAELGISYFFGTKFLLDRVGLTSLSGIDAWTEEAKYCLEFFLNSRIYDDNLAKIIESYFDALCDIEFLSSLRFFLVETVKQASTDLR